MPSRLGGASSGYCRNIPIDVDHHLIDCDVGEWVGAEVLDVSAQLPRLARGAVEVAKRRGQDGFKKWPRADPKGLDELEVCLGQGCYVIHGGSVAAIPPHQ